MNLWTEFRWAWTLLFLQAAVKVCPRHQPDSLSVLRHIRLALEEMPED